MYGALAQYSKLIKTKKKNKPFETGIFVMLKISPQNAQNENHSTYFKKQNHNRDLITHSVTFLHCFLGKSEKILNLKYTRMQFAIRLCYLDCAIILRKREIPNFLSAFQ
jgi:hypothetical protein